MKKKNISKTKKFLFYSLEKETFSLLNIINNLFFEGKEQYLLEAGDGVKILANLKHKWENF
ncbi:hypothetical protein BW425_21685 [Bacillus pseudomycoides]|uniref:Uncharacterized protein n=1 Tax=Bacillus pseudomycoides TaxID=64104 RepID=A0A1Y3MD69_9BACI|nr:hypothetical protein BW425_21685 [Bacillus pseudomycoides]